MDTSAHLPVPMLFSGSRELPQCEHCLVASVSGHWGIGVSAPVRTGQQHFVSCQETPDHMI